MSKPVRTNALSRRYAKALLDVARDKGTEDAWGHEIATLGEVFQEDALLRRSLTDPLMKEARRRDVLDALIDAAKPSEAVGQLLKEMLEHDRIAHVPSVAVAYKELLDNARGIVEVEVTTTEPLDDARRDRLGKALAKLTGKEVRLQEKVDADLIGGVVARVGDTVYDASARGRLEQIRAVMAGAE